MRAQNFLVLSKEIRIFCLATIAKENTHRVRAIRGAESESECPHKVVIEECRRGYIRKAAGVRAIGIIPVIKKRR